MPKTALTIDMQVVQAMLKRHGQMTYSEMALRAGEGLYAAIYELQRLNVIEAVYPEARPNDSGRQYWRLING